MKSILRLGLAAWALMLPAVALADPKDDARRHFTAGLASAQSGDYEVALQHFLAAEDAYPHPATEYNIARAYYDLGDLQNALTYFRLYQDSVPADKGADVQPTIQVIEARLRQERGTSGEVTPSGGGTMIAGGPTEEELARLAAIAAELEALSAAFKTRTVEELPPVTEGPEETPTETPAAIPELPDEFLSEAYERVVVTSSRYGQDPLDSPATVSVLTSEDIRLSGVSNLADLMRRVVGVDVMQLASGTAELSIRGFNRELNNKVLVLIDGRSIYLDFIGTTFWSNMPITLDEIERIEVIRGPGSAVYGANAVTGVINIITRTPGEGESVILRGEAGAPGYARGTGVVSGRQGNISYRFSSGYTTQARWGQDFVAADHSSVELFFPQQDASNTGLQSLRLNGRVDGTFGKKGYASVSAGMSRTFSEFYNIGALDDYGWDASHTYLRTDVAWEPVHLRMFWNRDGGTIAPWYEQVGDPRTLDTTLDSDVFDAELESNGSFVTGPVTHRLNGGVGFRYKRLADFVYAGQQPGDPPIEEYHYRGFISEEATIGWVKVVGTMRVDITPLLPVSQTLSPRGAVILRVAEKSSVRVSGGSAFRAPNMVENYMDFQLGTGVDGVYVQDYGDPDLRPERIVTAEVGFHDESTLFHTADVAVYYNRLTNLIGLEDVQSTRIPYDPSLEGWEAGATGWINNDDVFNGVGVEAEMKLFPIDGLDLFTNLNWTYITEETLGRDTSTSPWKINAGAAYRTPYRTDLSFDISYVSPQTWLIRSFDSTGALVATPTPLQARTLLNARVAVRPTPDERLELAGTVWNALSLIARQGQHGFQEHPKGQLIGPRVYASLTYRF